MEPVGGQDAKVQLAREWNANTMFISARRDELERISSGLTAPRLVGFRLACDDPCAVLAEYLDALEAAPVRIEGDLVNFEKRKNYYLWHNSPDEAQRFYRESLQADIIQRCQQRLFTEYASARSIRGLVTIVSDRTEVAFNALAAIEPEVCLLFWTEDQRERQYRQKAEGLIDALSRRSVRTKFIRCPYPDEDTLLDRMPHEIDSLTWRFELQPHELALDLAPGTKLMTWKMGLSAHPGNQLVYLRHDICSNAHRRIVPGSEHFWLRVQTGNAF
jgi:hypothetical protein